MFCFQIEDKAKASAAWTRITNAAKQLGVSSQEASCLWSVLAAIYHLGVASVSRGNMVRLLWIEVVGVFTEICKSIFEVVRVLIKVVRVFTEICKSIY